VRNIAIKTAKAAKPELDKVTIVIMQVNGSIVGITAASPGLTEDVLDAFDAQLRPPIVTSRPTDVPRTTLGGTLLAVEAPRQHWRSKTIEGAGKWQAKGRNKIQVSL
jgi:hypothetical protein